MVVCAATAMLMLDIAVVNTALSRIAEDLDTGLSGLQWVVDAYTLALASVVLTAGSLADRFGRRRLFTVGLAVFTAASAACAASTDIVFLDAFRAVQGIGAAIMFAVSLAILANASPDMRERAGALAAYGATIGASFARAHAPEATVKIERPIVNRRRRPRRSASEPAVSTTEASASV